MAAGGGLPWVRVSLLAMLRDVGQAGRATLTVEPRPDVATRRWWTFDWTGEDERPHHVEASSLDLLLQRAAETEGLAQREAERAWSGDVDDGWHE